MRCSASAVLSSPPRSLPPTAKARIDGDGFVLDGRWQWGTGVMHADWALLSGIVEEVGELENVRGAHSKTSRLSTTWNATGMTGTGSKRHAGSRAVCTGPASRAHPRDVHWPHRGRNGARGGHVPDADDAPFCVWPAATPAIGAAKAALKAFCDRAGSRVMYGSSENPGERAEHPRSGWTSPCAHRDPQSSVAREVAAGSRTVGRHPTPSATQKPGSSCGVRMAYVVRAVSGCGQGSV